MEDNISIGTLLRNAREQKKINIEDVASKTKININILKALEEDDVKNLPNIAYLKGFVKNYAKAVGVSQEQAQRALESTLQIKEKVTPTPIQVKTMESKSISEELDEQELKENLISIIQSFFNKKIILGLVVAVVAFGIIKTVVNWIAELNFESNKITNIDEEVKKSSSPNILKDSDANILEMDGNKKFAQTVLEENKEAAQESPKEEKKEVIPEVKKEQVVVVPKIIKPKEVEKKVVLEEPKKIEVKKEPTETVKKEVVKAVVRTDGKFPFREFSVAPAKTFNVDKESALNNDPSILPPNFKAAVLKDKQNVFIHAVDDDMWLSYKSDDDPIKRFVLRKGRKLLIKGDRILLFLGNYRVAKLFYNNELMNIKPTRSGVRSIIVPQSASADYKLPLFPVYKGKSYTAKEYMENMASEQPSSTNP